MQHDIHKNLLLYKPMKKYSYEKYIKQGKKKWNVENGVE